MDSIRNSVLDEAKSLINGDRQDEYGPPQHSFENIAAVWSVLFPGRAWSAADVAKAMMGLKLVRMSSSYKRDTAVDMAGYAALYAELGSNDEHV